ncbi:hypothetical protein ASF73_00130 [Xanthomonas sp. Leaf131]|nr:hypothetical protein ASF73_00130 [Xanthomonas sp. Leaf131]
MSPLAGRRSLELALAITLALQSTSGWTVLLAVLVYWVVVVLVAGLIDHLAEARANVAEKSGAATAASDPPPTQTQTQTSTPTSAIRLAPLPNKPLRPADLQSRLEIPRQWRRHVVDVAAYEEERYPRQDICTTVDVFLRSGDVLVLAFHPASSDGDAPAQWPCDLWRPAANHPEWRDVSATREVRVPVLQTGVYSVGIGQAYGPSPGVVSLWVCVPEPDRLALSLKPAHGSNLRYEQCDDGTPRARIEDETRALPHARLETTTVPAVPGGSVLLFGSAQDAWDVAASPDPATSWRAENTHLHRYFFQLSQGDVLTLELVWAVARFDQPLPLSDNCTGRTQGEVRVFKLVRGPDLAHLWASATTTAECRQITCSADGFYCLEVRLFGPAKWRTKPSSTFVDVRLWAAFLQRPQAVRAFALRDVLVEDWYRDVLPMPLPLQ